LPGWCSSGQWIAGWRYQTTFCLPASYTLLWICNNKDKNFQI
jgi:hypothetical protein